MGHALLRDERAYTDEGLFPDLAQDMFHLSPPPPDITKAADLPSSEQAVRPAWWDRLKPDADPQVFHTEVVASIAR